MTPFEKERERIRKQRDREAISKKDFARVMRAIDRAEQRARQVELGQRKIAKRNLRQQFMDSINA